MFGAANPCLDVEGIGGIGLPLSSPVGASLVADDGALLVVPAAKIRFLNREWTAWLEKEAAGVCAGLAGRKVQPSYRLRDLVIEGPGSRFEFPVLPVDVAGRLIVHLPTVFTGGRLQCRLGVQSKSINISSGSQLHTSILAAYSGVHIASEEIGSGYRLSLIYDIVQPNVRRQSIPPFPNFAAAALILERAMKKWNDGKSDYERNVMPFFLRQSYYDTKNFSPRSLTGSDDILMAHLIQLSQRLDFQVYFVQISFFQQPYGEYGSEDEFRYSRAPDEVDPKRIKNLHIESELPRELTASATDAQGVDVDILEFEFEDGGWDGGYLNGELTDVKPVQSEYETFGEDMDTLQIRVDETYERTAVLLMSNTHYPDAPVYEVIYEPEYAVLELERSVSSTPTTREEILVHSLKALKKKYEEVPRVLCKCACQWSDLKLLLETIETYQIASNLGLIGMDGCAVALKKFGWDSLRDFFKQVAYDDSSNIRRQELVSMLTDLAKDSGNLELEEWSKEQPERMLRSLNRSCIDEVDWLLDLGTSHGVDFLRDTVYPQLEGQELESDFWVHFVQQLRKHPMMNSLSAAFVRSCVVQAVNNITPFAATHDVAHQTYPYHTQEPEINSITDVFRLCRTTGNVDLCPQILDKMKQDAQEAKFLVECPPWKFHLELTRSLDDSLSLPEDPSTGDGYDFQPFFKEAIFNILRGEEKFSPCPFSADNLSMLVVAINRGGGYAVFEEADAKTLLSGRDTESLKTLTRYFVREWKLQCETRPGLVKALVSQAIDVFDTTALHQPSRMQAKPLTIDDVIGLLNFCFEVEEQSEIQHLLLHVVAPPSGASILQHVEKILVPLLSALRDYLVTRGLTLEAPPFAKCAANIVKAFSVTAMRQTPQDLIGDTRVGCASNSCSECRMLRNFFQRDGDDQTLEITRTGKIREHVANQVFALPKSWGTTCRTIKTHTTPYTIEIVKGENMTASGVWKENSERGKALLALLGDEPAQKRILGPNYSEVTAQICERNTKRSGDDEGQLGSPAKRARVARD
ncbi:2og-fe oxygenase [Favolaschia claudopus]|uniref:2og-fe oxygenase n=1 Tax=Favolaschia claudopus TaxID=2862362 RepID=A0AAV9Z7I7_9AGAR